MSDNIKDSLTIIIVSFNSGTVILKTLSGLIDSSLCDIIIVDNASVDGSQKLIKERFPSIKLIELPKNIGYGRAANIALKQVDTKYGLLINPDIILSEHNLQTVFCDVLKSDEQSAIFSPALKEEDYFSKGNIFVDYLIGAFLFFKMDVLKKVGYFDENIFLFYEEKDLERRIIDSGYKLVLQSDIYVEHLKSASTHQTKEILFLRNWHVSWSKFFYSYKHNIMRGNVSGYLLTIKYGLKAIFNLGDKRIKYKARFLGSIAYMKGEKAFSKNGYGQHSEKL